MIKPSKEVIGLLHKAGLSNTLSEIYAIVLVNDGIKASIITTFGIPRTEIYHNLARLEEMQLIYRTEPGVALYFPVSLRRPLEGHINCMNEKMINVTVISAKLARVLRR